MRYKVLVYSGLALFLFGCQPAEVTNEGGYTKNSRPNRHANQIDFVLPAGSNSVYKEYADFQRAVPPKPYSHKNEWVVYLAAPGWTNGGDKITKRLGSDASSAYVLSDFIYQNFLSDKVKVAWLQYDDNPSPNFVESIDKVPRNFIPHFLQIAGPKVDYYIHSPANRYEATETSMRYDQWIKPYLDTAKLVDGEYTPISPSFHEGFMDVKSDYWDHWARHWFIVDPSGKVVDAYFSNIGNSYLYGPDAPISSLIYHLDLDPDKLITKKPIQYSYKSLYSPPYFDGMHAELMDALNTK